MNTPTVALDDAERAALLDTLRIQQDRIVKLEHHNALLLRCVDAVAACHVCDLCAESAQLTLDMMRH